MAAIDDFNAAVAVLQTDVGALGTQMDTLMADLTAALAGAGVSNDPAIVAATANLSALHQQMQAIAVRDMPPAPAPAPTPAP